MSKQLRGGTMTPFGWVEGSDTAQNFSVDEQGNITAGGTWTWSNAGNLINTAAGSIWDSLASFGSNALALANNVINSGTAQNAASLYNQIAGNANKISSSEVVAQQNTLYSTIAEQVKKNQMIIYAGVGILGTYIIIKALKNRKSRGA